MTHAPLARTNVQLLNELIDAGAAESVLLQVRRACDLAGDLYSGHFHADGKPFFCHSMAVASMAARLGLSTNVIVAPVVHNVYENADFGDGLRDEMRMPGSCERKAALRRADWYRRQHNRWVGASRWAMHRVRLRTRLRQRLAFARG